jgi:hypothetical protein
MYLAGSSWLPSPLIQARGFLSSSLSVLFLWLCMYAFQVALVFSRYHIILRILILSFYWGGDSLDAYLSSHCVPVFGMNGLIQL